MKRFTYFILVISLFRIGTVAAQPTGYYNGTENKQGEELKAALNDIISGQTAYSYFYSKEIFKLSDADPANPNNIIEIYTGRSWPNDDYGSGGDQLNREHIWAKSHGNFDGLQPMDGDVHNLKPCDASVNIDKSNLDYDNGGTQHPEATGCYYSDSNWEPRDEDKGDVARIILYMDTRYQGENGELDLTAVDELNTYPYPEHGKLSTLLQWNLQDPPDDFERNRNNVIYSFQHNRNPFIDNPQFAELIWNNAALNTVSIDNISQEPVVPAANQAIIIHATIISSAGGLSNATLHYGTSWGNLNNSLAMSGSGSDFSAQIPGQNENTTIYYQVTAQDNNGSSSSVTYNFYVPKTFTGTLTSIYDIQGQGENSPFIDQVVSTTGIVTANFGLGYFIQDGTGQWNGLYVYDNGRNPSIGDSLVLTGTIDEYYNKTELKSVTGYFFISSNHTLPAAENISCAEAGEPYEGVLVTVDNATCTDAEYQANYFMWTVNDGTGDLLVHNTAVFEYVPTQGDIYTVKGPLDYDFDEWKVQLRFETDVISGPGLDITAPSISSVEVITSTTLKVQFSEEVEEISAENLENYSINKGVTVELATVHAIVKSQVFLTISQLTGGDYELTVQNVADLVGNAMQTVVAPFNFIGDITAPQITTVEVSAPNIINVQFSEEIEETSAESLANYGINNDVSILQAAVDDFIKSRVILTTSQLTGGDYELTVQNVADLAGNVMQTVVIPFSSTGVNEPVAGEMIMVYPNPTNGTINIDGVNEIYGDVVVSLYGIAGMKAYSGHFNVNGNKTITIKAENLAGGLYILEVKGNDHIARTKLMVR